MQTLRIKNFRCFEDTGDIRIKPLTFLVGANSSGKSSFLKFFPLLKQSLGVKRNGVFLWYDKNMVDFQSLGNVIRNKEEILTVTFSLENLHLSRGGRLRSKRIIN